MTAESFKKLLLLRILENIPQLVDFTAAAAAAVVVVIVVVVVVVIVAVAVVVVVGDKKVKNTFLHKYKTKQFQIQVKLNKIFVENILKLKS